MRITIVGTGNVAFHLSHQLRASGHEIVQVFSRQMNNAIALAQTVGGTASTDLATCNTESQIYLLAVADDAIITTLSRLLPPLANCTNCIIAHTSGATPTAPLNDPHDRLGVLYPLQSFSKFAPVDMREVVWLIHATRPDAKAVLHELAESLKGREVIAADDVQRAAFHLAAVFANNFSNLCYTVADEILKANQLPFELLLPLILQSASKLQNTLPSEAQTGPARRGDLATISRHLHLLETNHSTYIPLYELCTKLILEKY